MSSIRVLNDLFKAFDSAGPGLLTDPGSGGTITVTAWGQICSVVTEGIEARTLAQPTKPGLLCAVVFDTDVGDLTLTVTGGYNRDDVTSITFADAGDYVIFYSIKEGSSYYWRAISHEGTNVSMEEIDVDTLKIGGTAVTATAAEINQLDGAILADMTPGTGISTGTGTVCEHRVTKIGGFYKTEILLDITGLNGGGTAQDIIGKDGETANCHIGQITAAVNGTIIGGLVTCLLTPLNGDPDIDFYGSADEATGAQDAALSTITGEERLTDHSTWTAGQTEPFENNPDADGYLYLTTGLGATPGDNDYTVGLFLIEMWGT